MVGRQLVELSAAVELHSDADPVLVVLLLKNSGGAVVTILLKHIENHLQLLKRIPD